MTKPGDQNTAATFLFDVDGELDAAPVFDRAGIIVGWTGDGSGLVLYSMRMGDRSVPVVESWLVTVKTKKGTRLSIPESEMVLDVSPDGRRVLICKPEPANPGAESLTIPAVDLATIDGMYRTPLIDGYTVKTEGGVPWLAPLRHRFTPDGRSVVYAKIDPDKRSISLWSVSLTGNNRKRLVTAPERATAGSLCISPDSKHIAVVFEKVEPGDRGVPPTLSCDMAILDIDGTHQRSIPLPLLEFRILDWRPSAP
jgi:hypothetical protein